jgi:serine/threonine protein kinase
MSPEHLWSSKLADVRSDIWSLGVILYELVCGRVPFGAATFSAQVLKVALEPFPAMDGPRHVPREFERVVQRCLEKDSARRFENVGCLATALQPFAPAASRPIVERIQRLLSEPDHVALEPSPTHRAPLDAPSPVSSASTISRTRTSQPPARTSTMPSPIELEALAEHEVWRRVRAPGIANEIDASLRAPPFARMTPRLRGTSLPVIRSRSDGVLGASPPHLYDVSRTSRATASRA